MEHERKHVLMLGWEFPPVFTGGLGIACYNIVKSLSTKANVHLIVPFANAQNNLENIEITGLNHVEEKSVSEKIRREFPTVFVSRIPVALSAYPLFTASRESIQKSTMTDEIFTTISSWSDVSSYFQTRELYGGDVLQRTYLYTVAARELASRWEFDVIHAHDWPTFQAGVELKHDTHKPLVLHVHSLETDRAGEHARNEVYSIEHQALHEADKIIAVSEYTRQQIVSHYGIDEEKIEVAHNGAEETDLSYSKKKAGEKWITFVGRITFQKGPQFVVETARKLIRVFPNVRFIMAGNGDLFQSLIHEVARQRLGRYFSFTGFLSRKKVKDLLASSDVYFMPSVSEPFGLSALEATQQNTASVISNQSGAAEVLTNSLRADFWDTDRFANYLYAILSYPKLKHAIERQSHKDIEHLTWNKTTDKILNVYNAVTS